MNKYTFKTNQYSNWKTVGYPLEGILSVHSPNKYFPQENIKF